jgi:hypothetical protein
VLGCLYREDDGWDVVGLGEMKTNRLCRLFVKRGIDLRDWRSGDRYIYLWQSGCRVSVTGTKEDRSPLKQRASI